MNLRYPIALLLIFTALSAYSQDRYVIFFKDKSNTPFSISNPQQFLSQRAIDRRTRQGISITTEDLPVNPAYVQGLSNAGATILGTSKWFNAAIVRASSPAIVAALLQLPYVQNGMNIGRIRQGDHSTKLDHQPLAPYAAARTYASSSAAAAFSYGYSYNQINMIGLNGLHDLGYTGNGLLIAVLDAGFLDANLMACFDSLFTQNRIVATRDFVDNENDVYDDHYHGSAVLSCMASIVSDSIIGTAPHASYLLLRSEDAATEYIIEEYNWAMAAEYADSAGADIINSSLGYTTFNDPLQNHSYTDMNGDTAPGTIAADFAASRGIIVVNSAGNEGNSGWNYIGVPADGDSVLAVGAVNDQGNYAFFSSNGPSFDGRVKPDVSARGQNTWLYTPFSNNQPIMANGTSFSSPVMAGAVACLWQAWGTKSNMDIIQAVKRSASQFNNPDSLLGYGIPDFTLANSLLGLGDINVPTGEQIHLFPNPWNGTAPLSILFYASDSGPAFARIFDMSGKLVSTFSFSTVPGGYTMQTFATPLQAGMYLLEYQRGNSTDTRKLIVY